MNQEADLRCCGTCRYWTPLSGRMTTGWWGRCDLIKAHLAVGYTQTAVADKLGLYECSTGTSTTAFETGGMSIAECCRRGYEPRTS